MYGICIEASHKKGMGHLYRMIYFATHLKQMNEEYRFFINGDYVVEKILDDYGIPYTIVDLYDYHSNWESKCIQKYNIKLWLNDRLATEGKHVLNIKKEEIFLVSIDDIGKETNLVDLKIISLPTFYNKKAVGQKIIKGIEYLILNPEIKKFRRIHEKKESKSIIITLGGSDTYGVTIKVLKGLLENSAVLEKHTIICYVGPSFRHINSLETIIKDTPVIMKKSVDSMIEELSKGDIAITGGGITPFESCSLGVPTLVIANEYHEVDNAKYLEGLGCAIFLGHYESINYSNIKLDLLSQEMSHYGIERISGNGVENVFNIIKEYYNEYRR